MKNNGWWCLYYDKNYELKVSATFGCSKKDFYADIVRNEKPRLIVTINRMRLKRGDKKILAQMNEILKGENA